MIVYICIFYVTVESTNREIMKLKNDIAIDNLYTYIFGRLKKEEKKS